MQKDEEITDIVKKISDEISSVKNHVSDAKYSLSVDDYSNALKHLKEAEKTSTCSYCKNKVQEILYDIEHNKNICNIHSKNCDSNKTEILHKLEDFYLKLPDIESIKKQKSISPSSSATFDIFGGITKTFDEMGKSAGKMWESMFKLG